MKKIIGGGILILLVVYALPHLSWGRITIQPSEIITVTGEATKKQDNQIASFSAGVESVKDTKEAAVAEVNTKMTALQAAIKNFGIDSKDVKTQNISTYQDQGVYPMMTDTATKKINQWHVNNTIEITLRDSTKATALNDLLNASGANSVNGPNFRIDDTNMAANSAELLAAAVKNATEKATTMAKAGNRSLGKMISVNENGGGVAYPMVYAMAKDSAGAGSAPVEPGSTTVSKSVSVIFELK